MKISVKQCKSFNNVNVGSFIFFDMGSIRAEILKVDEFEVEVEAQNEGPIYEN